MDEGESHPGLVPRGKRCSHVRGDPRAPPADRRGDRLVPRPKLGLLRALPREARAGGRLVAVDPHTGDRQQLERLGGGVPSLLRTIPRALPRCWSRGPDRCTRCDIPRGGGRLVRADRPALCGWVALLRRRGRRRQGVAPTSVCRGVVVFDDYHAYSEVRQAVHELAALGLFRLWGSVFGQAVGGASSEPPPALDVRCWCRAGASAEPSRAVFLGAPAVREGSDSNRPSRWPHRNARGRTRRKAATLTRKDSERCDERPLPARATSDAKTEPGRRPPRPQGPPDAGARARAGQSSPPRRRPGRPTGAPERRSCPLRRAGSRSGYASRPQNPRGEPTKAPRGTSQAMAAGEAGRVAALEYRLPAPVATLLSGVGAQPRPAAVPHQRGRVVREAEPRIGQAPLELEVLRAIDDRVEPVQALEELSPERHVASW